MESRLKVLKKELEDYEVFRSTEEKESKELLVSGVTLASPGWEATSIKALACTAAVCACVRTDEL